MSNYLYVLGDNPYTHSHGEMKGNGDWHISADNLEEALKIMFNSMPFPGEPTGRKFFLPGISLEGVADLDVIQVWSNEPGVAERTVAILKDCQPSGLHDWRDHYFGLHTEIKVTDLDKYMAPAQALLAAATIAGSATDNANLSPMGASLMRFGDGRHEMQTLIQREQMELARREWEMESLKDKMEEKVKTLDQQINILNTYLHGTRQRAQITSGKAGTGRYAVFQNRQFLSEEIALLANFGDGFDFQKMEDLERWLCESGRLWKFLPFERCILATRIRQDKKDYGDPMVSLWNNYANMQNIIWIRDGENVFHVDTEFDFHNAIFPDKDQFERTLRVCLDHIWRKSFKRSGPKDHWGHTDKTGEHDVMGKLRRKPLEVEEPYFTVRTVKEQFDTMEDWLKSEFYTDLLDKQIRQAVMDYLQEVNKRQMIFAVLLQGIVDTTQLLDIPKGTDLFNWENVDRYFTLIYDYSAALPWKGISQKIEPYLNFTAQEGDWIVAMVNEYIPAKGYGDGKTYKERQPILFKVAEVVEVQERRMLEGMGEYEDTPVLKPVVKFYPWSNRRRRGDDYGERHRTVQPIRLVLKHSEFMKVPMPSDLAEKILDDRQWKQDHRWAVPLMVNYRGILKAVKLGKNATEIEWD
jgi:hypothetical protein